MLQILRKFLEHKHLPAKPAKTGAKNHNVLDVLIYAGIRLTNYHNLILSSGTGTLGGHVCQCRPPFSL
jgi:hypothetical protein